MHDVKIVLLIDDFLMPAWQVRIIETISRMDHVEVGLVVKKRRQAELGRGTANVNRPNYPVDKFLFDTWKKVDRCIFRIEADALRLIDASHLVDNVHVIEMHPSADQNGKWLNERDIDEIDAYQPTLFIQLGCPEVVAEILEIAPCGVWKLRLGDYRLYGLDNEGIWEVLFNQRTTKTSLSMCVARDNSPTQIEIYESWSGTYPFSFYRNINHCYWKGARFFPRMLRRLTHSGESAFLSEFTPERIKKELLGDGLTENPRQVPSIRPLATLLWKLTAAALSRILYREQWILLYCNAAAKMLPDPAQGFKRLVPPKDRFWADPCAIQYCGRTAVFIEEWEYKKTMAHISAIEFDSIGNPILPPVKVLEKPYHLSYPFVFEDGGELYMIPETHENKTVEIYRCIRFPNEWQFVMNLLEGLVAVDTTVWHHKGRYWLFMNVIENDGESTTDELFLYSSDKLLTTDWRPHPCNPIVSDVRRARPAGRIFEYHGQWYRPSQDSSGGYGKAISVNRIDTIDEADYCETPISRLEAKWDKEVFRTHTLTRAGNLFYFDGLTLRGKM